MAAQREGTAKLRQKDSTAASPTTASASWICAKWRAPGDSAIRQINASTARQASTRARLLARRTPPISTTSKAPASTMRDTSSSDAMKSKSGFGRAASAVLASAHKALAAIHDNSMKPRNPPRQPQPTWMASAVITSAENP